MDRRLPRGVRTAAAVDRFIWRAAKAASIVARETVIALTPKSERDAVGAWVYDRQNTYAPGGDTYEAGLFDWEERLLARPEFPKTGTVLIGGAGGGRELRALRERGYQVVAFEPAPDLQEKLGEGSFLGSYADLVQAVASGTGPLAEIASRRFDAILLGWGSLTHVIEHHDRVALLKACRVLTSGPVLVSYLRSEEGPELLGYKLKRVMRRALGVRVPAGVEFEFFGGFIAYLTEDELESMAGEAGYRVAFLRTYPYGHAVLTGR